MLTGKQKWKMSGAEHLFMKAAMHLWLFYKEFLATASTMRRTATNSAPLLSLCQRSSRRVITYSLPQVVRAEQITYQNRDDEGGKSDRSGFEGPAAPPFQETLDEAQCILRSNSRKLKRLVSILKAKVRQADYDVGRLPEVGMDGSDKKYAVLLSKLELEDAVRRF
jgi:hypothetical protein